MKRSREFYLLILFLIFCVSLISIYLFKLYERNTSPRIVLVSEKNPLDVELPEAKNSNMSISDIDKSLNNISLEEDVLLNIDDIE